MKRLCIIILTTFLFHSCKKTVDPHSELTKIVDYSDVSITLEGLSKGDKILERGFCWSTNSAPTIFDNKIAAGSGEGDYTATIENLSSDVVYHIRAYCASRLKISYSDEKIVRTISTPTMTTYFPSGTSINSFTCGGTIYGIVNVADMGICYGVNPFPTVADSKMPLSPSAGGFSINVTGLTPNTLYYYRTYVVMGPLTFYSNQAMVRTYYSTVTDVDAITYYTIKIGAQEWMAENLKVEHYQDGSPINYCSKTQWDTISISGGKYGNYNDNPAYKSIYGHLYDGHVVTNSISVAPAGWHVPNNFEWANLENFLGGPLVAGGKMIRTNPIAFNDTICTNSSGFSVLMGGQRITVASDIGLNAYSFFWLNNFESTLTYGGYRSLYYGSLDVQGNIYVWRCGLYIRCLKN